MDAYRPPLLIRADASPEIGSGHAMRCWALVQAWQRMGGRAIWACRSIPENLRARFVASGVDVHSFESTAGSESDAASVRQLAEQVAANWVVLDGYGFDLRYQQALGAQPRSWRVMLIDDSRRPTAAEADLVLNQNIYADGTPYPTIAVERRLLGTRFALLRPEFRGGRATGNATARTPMPETAPACRRVLVSMGGADPSNVTAIA